MCLVAYRQTYEASSPKIHNSGKVKSFREVLQFAPLYRLASEAQTVPGVAQRYHWLFCFSLDNLCPARGIPDGCVFEKSHDKEIISEAAGFGAVGLRLLSDTRGWHAWMLPEYEQKIF